MTHCNINPALRARAIALYTGQETGQELTAAEVGKILGSSKQNILKLLKRAGCKLRPSWTVAIRQRLEHELAAIIAHYHETKSVTKTARKWGVTHYSIRRLFARHNVPLYRAPWEQHGN